MAASLAAGLWGIEHEVEPPAAVRRATATPPTRRRCRATCKDAVELLRRSRARARDPRRGVRRPLRPHARVGGAPVRARGDHLGARAVPRARLSGRERDEPCFDLPAEPARHRAVLAHPHRARPRRARAARPRRSRGSAMRRPLVVTDAGVVKAGLADARARGARRARGSRRRPLRGRAAEPDRSRRGGGARRVPRAAAATASSRSAAAAPSTRRSSCSSSPRTSRRSRATTTRRAATGSCGTTCRRSSRSRPPPGTGSEVGRSGVATLPDTGRKTVIFSPYLMPRVAICDPELTVGPAAARSPPRRAWTPSRTASRRTSRRASTRSPTRWRSTASGARRASLPVAVREPGEPARPHGHDDRGDGGRDGLPEGARRVARARARAHAASPGSTTGSRTRSCCRRWSRSTAPPPGRGSRRWRSRWARTRARGEDGARRRRDRARPRARRRGRASRRGSATRACGRRICPRIAREGVRGRLAPDEPAPVHGGGPARDRARGLVSPPDVSPPAGRRPAARTSGRGAPSTPRGGGRHGHDLARGAGGPGGNASGEIDLDAGHGPRVTRGGGARSARPPAPRGRASARPTPGVSSRMPLNLPPHAAPESCSHAGNRQAEHHRAVGLRHPARAARASTSGSRTWRSSARRPSRSPRSRSRPAASPAASR